MTDPTAYTVDDTLAALRRKIEADHDHDFGLVYLDNARAPGQSDTQFRAHLSALAKRDLYRVIDGHAFGAVRKA